MKEEAEKLKADADEILLFAKKENCKTAADSAAYASELMALHKANPQESRYFQHAALILQRAPGRQAGMDKRGSDLGLNNKMAWAIKGETEMKAEKWDEAVASYKKAIEIDPEFTAVLFNIGTCLNSKAIEVKDKLADKRTGGLTTANAAKVKSLLEEAKTYLLKAKELDPERKTVNWAYALYQVYYSLKDTANANAMEKLLNQ